MVSRYSGQPSERPEDIAVQRDPTNSGFIGDNIPDV